MSSLSTQEDGRSEELLCGGGDNLCVPTEQTRIQTLKISGRQKKQTNKRTRQSRRVSPIRGACRSSRSTRIGQNKTGANAMPWHTPSLEWSVIRRNIWLFGFMTVCGETACQSNGLRAAISAKHLVWQGRLQRPKSGVRLNMK